MNRSSEKKKVTYIRFNISYIKKKTSDWIKQKFGKRPVKKKPLVSSSSSDPFADHADLKIYRQQNS